MNVSTQTDEVPSTAKPKSAIPKQVIVFLVIALLASIAQGVCWRKIINLEEQLLMLRVEAYGVHSLQNIAMANQQNLQLYLLNGNAERASCITRELMTMDGPWIVTKAGERIKSASRARKEWLSQVVQPLMEQRRKYDSAKKGSLAELQKSFLASDPEAWSARLSGPLSYAEIVEDQYIRTVEDKREDAWWIFTVSMMVAGFSVLFALSSIVHRWRAERRRLLQ